MTSSKIVIKKLIAAPVAKVFAAWSKPEIMQHWFFPPQMDWSAQAANEFKVGGWYTLEMKGNDGTTYKHTGEYKEIIPNKKIVFTWNSHVVSGTLVTVELHEVAEKTEITLTHDLFPNDEVREKHQNGWTGCLDNLQNFFQTKNTTTDSYHCKIRYRAPIQTVYAAITQENGLKNWWTQDCTVAPMMLSSKSTFRFGKTFNVMQTKELIPNQKVVWECVQMHFEDTDNPKLDNTDEWTGTTLIFQLSQNSENETDLHFIHEGLTQHLACFDLCQSKWDYFLKESLKTFVETGVGGPYA